MRSSLSCPPASEPSDEPCFQAHEWTRPSSFPPLGESLFAMCHVSELSNPLLPLSPLHSLIPPLLPSSFLIFPFSSSPSPPSICLSLLCTLPLFEALHLLLPPPPLQLVSPRL